MAWLVVIAKAKAGLRELRGSAAAVRLAASRKQA